MALSGLPNKSLVAELQSALRMSKDVVAMLSGHESQQLEMAMELAATKEDHCCILLCVKKGGFWLNLNIQFLVFLNF